MKNYMTRLIVLFLFVTGLGFTVLAQPQMPGTGNALNASLAKLFGDIKAFSAQADTQMRDKSNNETTQMPMGFALLDGKIRMEIDLGQMKSKQMPAEALAGMKQMGMDRMVTLIQPEKNQMTLIYPALQAYAEIPIPAEEGADKDVKVEKTAVGKETVDGHPCIKNKVMVTDSKGKKQEGLMWNATDLKEFPVKLEFADNDATVTMQFKAIKMAKPDSKQFDPPADYAKYNSMQQLMQAGMQRMLGSGPGKPAEAKP
jgi:hypothetical protein